MTNTTTNTTSLDWRGATALVLIALAGIFTVLKWVHLITWAWVWVLSPLWIGLILLFALLALGAVAIILGGVLTWLGSLLDGRKR